MEARIRVFTDLLNTDLFVCKMRACDLRFVCFNNHLMFASCAMCEEWIWAEGRHWVRQVLGLVNVGLTVLMISCEVLNVICRE